MAPSVDLQPTFGMSRILSALLLPEYENLNSTLDQLDSCLDVLEQQNDSLYERMLQLLESNRQTREELQREIHGEAPPGGGGDAPGGGSHEPRGGGGSGAPGESGAMQDTKEMEAAVNGASSAQSTVGGEGGGGVLGGVGEGGRDTMEVETVDTDGAQSMDATNTTCVKDSTNSEEAMDKD